ncbi:MAG: S8 family serine peptidase [Xanthomonadales bacterium]|nr:S8 family serine peptidase [Xanthomonadales bacterium]
MFRRSLLPLALLLGGHAYADTWLRIDRPDAALRARLPASAIDYGGFVWLPEQDAPELATHARAQRVVDAHALSIDGARVDPLQGVVAGGNPWLQPASHGGADFRLVQLYGPPRPEDLAELQAAGVRAVRYLAPFSYIVWADAEQLATLQSRSAAVRWTGPLLPAQRVPPQSRGLEPAPVRAMGLVDRARADPVLQALATAGGTLVQRSDFIDELTLVELDLAGAAFLAAAQIPGVYTLQRIERSGGERSEMTHQSIVGGYDAGFVIQPGYLNWLTPTGVNGAGVRVAIVDGGIRTTHVDIAAAVVPCVGSNGACTASNNAHGTHVAGAVAGRGSSGILDAGGFLRGQGVAPGASVIQLRYNPFLSAGGPGGMVANGMISIYRDAASSGAQLANNSWGPTSTPQCYDIPTMQVDLIARDADSTVAGNQPVLTVWSVMNGNGDRNTGPCAPSSLGSPDEAKNLFSVGSTRMLSGSSQPGAAMFDVSSNSAHGPACDGRTVPHIVAPGCSTDSLTATSDTSFGSMCGTSMASPVVSGASALYWQRHRDVHGEDPSPALVKAVFTAAADNLIGRLDADGRVIPQRPNRLAGWGRINLDAVINPGVEVWLHDQDTVFTASGNEYTVQLQADDPAEPVRIMLAWTDAPGPGSGGTTPSWTNDLDLSVTAGATYRGNVIDATSGFSASGGSADARNNLEGVFLSPAQHSGASFELRVLAATIAADALSPHAAVSPRQDFALVCYNCVAGGPPQAVFGNGFESANDDLFTDGFE